MSIMMCGVQAMRGDSQHDPIGDALAYLFWAVYLGMPVAVILGLVGLGVVIGFMWR